MYLAKVPHLPDVLDLVLSSAGGNDELRTPLAQVADDVRTDEPIASKHGGSDTARLRKRGFVIG